MRILLTNDDGIMAAGLVAMYRQLIKRGTVDVVAPESVQSATGHGITISTPLLTQRVTVEGAFTGTAVAGRPADCVKLAVTQLMDQAPDLVVSGINAGANVGINVLYSGTVAAATEAAFLGLPSVAVSLYLRPEVPTNFAWAAEIAMQVIEQIRQAGLRGGQAISINLPALPAGSKPAGIRLVRQCTRPWTDTYDRRKDPKGRDYFWNTSLFTLDNAEPDSDVSSLREGYVTITPLQFDLTDHQLLAKWQSRPWAL